MCVFRFCVYGLSLIFLLLALIHPAYAAGNVSSSIEPSTFALTIASGALLIVLMNSAASKIKINRTIGLYVLSFVLFIAYSLTAVVTIQSAFILLFAVASCWLIYSSREHISQALSVVSYLSVLVAASAFILNQLMVISISVESFLAVQFFVNSIVVLQVQLAQANNGQRTLTEEHGMLTSNIPAYDSVTNLPSLAQAIMVIEDSLNNAQPSDFAFLAFKPLNFNQVNRVIGHQNSDLMLLQFAYKMAKFCRENKLLVNFGSSVNPERVCRLNGLDFLVVIDKRNSQHPIKIVLESLTKQLVDAAPKAMSFRNFSLNYELTFGANLAKSNFSASHLIAQTSDALLLAERSASPLAYYNHESEIFSEYQLSNMEKVRKAIEEGRARCLYQPQVSVENKEVNGFEVVFDPSSVLNEPLERDQFMRLVENTGVIYMITKLCIVSALNLLANLAKQDLKGVTVAINLSSQDLLQPELADFIEIQADARSVSLENLVMELSEDVLLSGAFRARMMIDQLRALGVKVAVDDFSGSYEALKYLRKAAIAQVKIDCCHLSEKDRYLADKTIVSALINVIRKMDIPVIATEINNQSTQKALIEAGGDIVQGKVIHQGLTVSQFEQWLNAWQKAS